VLRISTSIPQNITAQWSEFVAEWCLGIDPGYAPSEVQRAFDALHRLWPEAINKLEADAAHGSGGVSTVVSAIAKGLTLAACEPLISFGPVIARLRNGEHSALAELEFADALVRCGFKPALEPQLGQKTLDCLVRVGSERVYVEVIAPEQAAEIKDAQATLERLAAEVVKRAKGSRTKILLSDEPGSRFDTILDAVTSTLPDGRVHNIEGIARVRRDFLGPQPPNVGPLIVNPDPRPTIAVASARVGGGDVSTAAMVRLTITDERAHRLLSNELSHFSPTERNILAIRTTNVPGAMKWWWPLVLRWFQPSRNRRVGGIILYEQAAILDQQYAVRQRWRVIENPYAYMPVPRSLINGISALDESAAWGER
jgi:hypothetical protein